MVQSARPIRLPAVVVGYVNDHKITEASVNNLIGLYEAWNKPEKANEWRVKLVQIEDYKE